MREDLFLSYEYYQKERLKGIILKFIDYFLNNAKEVEALDITNAFLDTTAKPSWFKNDLDTIKSIHEYVSFVYENWENFKPHVAKTNVKFILKDDILEEKKRKELQSLIKGYEEIVLSKEKQKKLPSAVKNFYIEKPLKEIDFNYLSKGQYGFMKHYINSVIKASL